MIGRERGYGLSHEAQLYCYLVWNITSNLHASILIFQHDSTTAAAQVNNSSDECQQIIPKDQ